MTTDQAPDDVARNAGAAARNGSAAPQRRPLTSTERSRNSRARKRAEAATARRRPDLSPAAVDPLAAAIVQELLGSGDCPAHLLAEDGQTIRPRWRYAVSAFARTEAVVRLTAQWVATLPGVEAALTTLTETGEEAVPSRGGITRRTVTTVVEAALPALDRAEKRAAAAQAAVGLSPASAARMRAGMKPEGPNLMQRAAQLILDDRRAAPGEREDAR